MVVVKGPMTEFLPKKHRSMLGRSPQSLSKSGVSLGVTLRGSSYPRKVVTEREYHVCCYGDMSRTTFVGEFFVELFRAPDEAK